MDLKPYLAALFDRRDLTFDEAREAFDIIMSGNATEAQIGSYLTALRFKGETSDEIAGSAASMRSHVLAVDVKEPAYGKVLDIVGTGGDGKHTFNISTTTSFVVAGAGYTVAKHGNLSVSSKSGAADVLKALGANLDIDAQQVETCIERVGIGFLFAIKHHPAMRYAIGPRRQLAQRTIFNILGPLTNPASASHCLIGVFVQEFVKPMALTLGKLGTTAAYVVHGADGLDELSTTGINYACHLRDGQVVETEIDPQALGFAKASLEQLIGGTPEENALLTRGVLDGSDRGPRRDIVLLNAAAALSTESGDLRAGLEAARASIDSGAAIEKLNQFVAVTQELGAQ